MTDPDTHDDPQHSPVDMEDAELSALYFRVAFECAPLGMMVLQDHTVVACNQALCNLFELAESRLLGARFNTLFPGGTPFEAIQSAMREVLVHGGRYRETRLMRPLGHDGAPADSAMRQVSLQFVGLNAGQRLTMCSVEADSVPLVDHGSLTPREREVASLLRERYTAKEIGRSLGISHRTVEIYRTRLMKKYGVRNAAGLVRVLLREPDAPDGPEPVASATALAPVCSAAPPTPPVTERPQPCQRVARVPKVVRRPPLGRLPWPAAGAAPALAGCA